MILSRSLTLLRLSNHVLKNSLFQNGRQNLTKQIKRDGHGGGEYYYRKVPEPSPAALRYSEALGAFFWWWLVWHIITDGHELIRLSPYPDPASWTDEELGIPPEDED